MESNFNQFGFSDIGSTNPYVIKNFILSNNTDYQSDIDLDYPFSFDGIVFGICLSGNTVVKIDYREYYLEKNSIITIFPNQIVESGTHSEDYLIELLAFSFDFISDLPLPKDFDIPLKVGKMPVLKVSERDAQNILRYHAFIVDTFNYSKRSLVFDQIIKALLNSVLLEIGTLYIEQDTDKSNEHYSSRSEEITEQFLLLLKDHYKIGRSASYYAEKLYITPKYLSSTLKKVTGRSINRWIEEAVIIGAKIFLKSTNMTVLQISEELNFPNASYFGRFFKKYTNMTPVKYREE